MGRLTTEQFVEKVRESNPELLNHVEILEYCTYDNIRAVDKYGELKLWSKSVLQDGFIPTIFSAVDKTNYFINRAEEVYGTKYTYEKLDYINTETPVIITCPKHGDFVKRPLKFLTEGQECSKCLREPESPLKQKRKIKFIDECRKIHGDKYDYNLVKYNHAHEKVTIICPVHGEFRQSANTHKRGGGCRRCSIKESGLKRRITNGEFIKRAAEVHGDKYDYSLVDCTKGSKVVIICKTHGQFKQNKVSHLSGSGCIKCANRYQYDTKEYIRRARESHGDMYDYSRTSYINSKINVLITCKLHGDFSQRPHIHLRGGGCPTCAMVVNTAGSMGHNLENIREAKYVETYLYVSEFKKEEEIFWKIGHSRCPEDRFRKSHTRNGYTSKILYKEVSNLFDAITKEQEIIHKYREFSYIPKRQFEGHTECFSVNPLEHFKEFRKEC